MPTEPLALSTRPPEPAEETDYDAICAAVTATARGRWFLTEFARRNRHSDTAQVLDAIARMEAAVVGERAQYASQQANQQVRIELLDMARTIAQTRAEVAESRPKPPAFAASAMDAADPNIAAAAERLRQIAWTMRACGVEVPASDQIGQIADTILVADAMHSLGDQRSHKLTEVLHYLEHRIERMLDGHLAAAKAVDAESPSEAPPPPTNVHDQTAAIAIAMRALAPAHVAAVVNVEAHIEPTSSVVAKEAAMAAAATAADPTEFAVDDDVLLTVANTTPDFDPAPALSVASEPASTAGRIDPEPPVVAEATAASLEIPAAEANPIAMQVEQDLNGLADDAAEDRARHKDAPQRPPVAQASKAKLSTALAAIETELRANATPPAPRANSPPPPKSMASAAAKPAPPPVKDGPLAALMAMSEEERIALFS